MNPFLDYINSMSQEGKSLDEIAAAFTEAMNQKSAEAAAADRLNQERSAARSGLIDNLCASIDTGIFDYKTAASAAAVTFIDSHPDATKKDIDNWFSQVLQAIEGADSFYQNFKGKDPIEVLRGQLNDAFVSLLDVPKQEPKVKKNVSDRDAIMKFLRELGL